MPVSNDNNNFVREAYQKILEKTENFQKPYQNVAKLTKQLISEKSTSAETSIQKTTIQPNQQLKKLIGQLPKALAFVPVLIAARSLITGCLLIARSNLSSTQASQESQSETTSPISTASAKPKENLNFTPQIIQKTNGEYIVIKPADKTTFLALQGGGVKGMAYPSYLKALNENAPFITDLKDVAGASAGSMMAFLISSGVDLNTIDEYVNKANPFEQMLGGIDNLMMGKGFFSAGNLAKGLKEMSQRAASSYCEGKDWDTIEQKLTDSEVDKAAIAKFKSHVETGFKEGVTFSDLDLLHRLEPAQFKRFHATGYEKHTKETIYFNAQNFPDMHCHDAVRISMAIPTVVRPIILEGREFSDGGQGSNLPIEALEKAGQKTEGRTLALVFSNSGRTHLAQATPMTRDVDLMTQAQNKVAAAINFLCGKEITEINKELIAGTEENVKKATSGGWHGSKPTLFRQVFLGEEYVENQKVDKQKLYDLGSEAGVVPHGKLDTLSFLASAKKIEECKLEAKLAGVELAMRRNEEASYKTFRTFEEALNSLNPKQRAAWEAENQSPI